MNTLLTSMLVFSVFLWGIALVVLLWSTPVGLVALSVYTLLLIAIFSGWTK